MTRDTRYSYLPVPIATLDQRRPIPRVLAPVTKQAAGHHVQRLLGFWLCWHALGGMDAMLASGLWSRAGVYDNLAEFKRLYGMTPDELLPELALEVKRDSETWPERYLTKAQQRAAGWVSPS